MATVLRYAVRNKIANYYSVGGTWGICHPGATLEKAKVWNKLSHARSHLALAFSCHASTWLLPPEHPAVQAYVNIGLKSRLEFRSTGEASINLEVDDFEIVEIVLNENDPSWTTLPPRAPIKKSKKR